MTSSGANSPQPGSTQWVAGAEPVALCMSCKARFEPGSAEICPKCQVTLSSIRSCPKCQRFQSAEHLRCPYCSTSFVVETDTGSPGTSSYRSFRKQIKYPVPAVLGGAFVVAALLGLLIYTRLRQPSKPKAPIGRSYVLDQASLRRDPSPSAPVLQELRAPEIVNITDCVFDVLGNHWFEISLKGSGGYVLARELAPPKASDPEAGYKLLRHSLLALEGPESLTAAAEAVSYYQRGFPASPHVDELRWLFAETTRKLGQHSDRRQALLRRAEEAYKKIAEGNGEFADRARRALAQIRSEAAGARASPSHDSFALTVEGGSLSPARSGAAAGPVHTLTLISQTPLFVRVTEPVEISPQTRFQGEIEQDIRVNDQVAVPKGSVCRLEAVEVPGKAAQNPGVTTVTLRLTAVVVQGQAYQVSAGVVRIEPPNSSTPPSQAHSRAAQLSAGTRLVFRLVAPLLVTRS